MVYFLVAFAVSIDGMLAGLALGMRKVRIGIGMLSVIAVVTFICVLFSMKLTQWMIQDQTSMIVQWAGGFLLIFVGLLALRPNDKAGTSMRKCGLLEGVFIGLGVAADASIASASLALDGANPWMVALIMGAMHFTLVWVGNAIGCKGLRLQGLAMRIIPAVLLFIIGLLRLPIFS